MLALAKHPNIRGVVTNQRWSLYAMFSKLKHLSLRTKIIGNILIPILCLGFLLTMFQRAHLNSKENLRIANEVNLPLMQLSMHLGSEIDQVFQNLLLVAVSDADSYSAEDVKKITSSFKTYLEVFEKYKSQLLSAEPGISLSALEEGNTTVKDLIEMVAGAAEKQDLTKKENRESFLLQIKLAITPLATSVLSLRQEISKIDAHRIEMTSQWRQDVTSKSERSNYLVFSVALSIVVTTLILAFLSTRSIQAEFLKLRETLELSGAQISAASVHLTTTSNDLAESASISSEALDASVKSVNSLASSVQTNAEITKESASKTNRSMGATTETVQLIDQLNLSLKENEAAFGKMDELLSIIDDISFQTNLLALNAAVEAARAGDQGKGFAVVADAVRGLALKTSEASSHIASVLDESRQRVRSGSQLAEKSISAIRSVNDSIKDLMKTNESVVSMSNEQSEQVESLVAMLAKLNDITQQNSSSSREVAANSEDISTQSGLLKKFVADFNVYLDGKKTA
jgi:methyl-accepting chemotaxis protein